MCGICETEVMQNSPYVAVSTDKWTGKLSEEPEYSSICHMSCVRNAMRIIGHITKEV